MISKAKLPKFGADPLQLEKKILTIHPFLTNPRDSQQMEIVLAEINIYTSFVNLPTTLRASLKMIPYFDNSEKFTGNSNRHG